MEVCAIFLFIIILLILVILSIFDENAWYKIMFRLIKKIFMELLINIVNTSNHAKCVLSSNQKCDVKPIFINLFPNEYCQEFHYYHLN